MDTDHLNIEELIRAYRIQQTEQSQNIPVGNDNDDGDQVEAGIIESIEVNECSSQNAAALPTVEMIEPRIEPLQFDLETFIQEVQDNPCIWNTSLRVFKENKKKKIAWQNISSTFGGKDGKHTKFLLIIYTCVTIST